MVGWSSGDGPVDEVRLATPADVPAIVELYRGLSAESRRMRFSTAVSDDALAWAASLGGGFEAVIEISAGRIVGEARLDLDPARDNEFAITVADDAQGRGVGTTLLEALRAHALRRGVVTMRGLVRMDNIPMLTLLRRIGGVIVMADSGDIVIDIASDRQMPAWSRHRATTRVLIEAAGSVERQITTALRSAGYDVRQCGGPSAARREPCPLIGGGQCRLAQDADAIICLLPEGEDGAAVMADHVTHRPASLAAGRALSRR